MIGIHVFILTVVAVPTLVFVTGFFTARLLAEYRMRTLKETSRYKYHQTAKERR